MTEKFNLLDVRPEHFRSGKFNPGGAILSWLRNEDAFWEYDGEPSADKPHAELSGGRCSNGFIDMPSILCFPNIAEILGKELARRLMELRLDVNCVVSSPYSALTLGHEVAKELGAVFRHPIKDPADPKQKKMLWRGEPIPAGSKVLQVEELITTTSTVWEVQNAIIQGTGYKTLFFVPEVGTLVHRPEKAQTRYNWVVIIPLLEKVMQNFSVDCPYCKVDSKKLRPRDNWAELTRSS